MSSDPTVAQCIAEAERRVDAIEVLCEIITGQVKGERRELQAIRSALAAPIPVHEERSPVAAGAIEPAMLEG